MRQATDIPLDKLPMTDIAQATLVDLLAPCLSSSRIAAADVLTMDVLSIHDWHSRNSARRLCVRSLNRDPAGRRFSVSFLPVPDPYPAPARAKPGPTVLRHELHTTRLAATGNVLHTLTCARQVTAPGRTVPVIRSKLEEPLPALGQATLHSRSLIPGTLRRRVFPLRLPRTLRRTETTLPNTRHKRSATPTKLALRGVQRALTVQGGESARKPETAILLTLVLAVHVMMLRRRTVFALG